MIVPSSKYEVSLFMRFFMINQILEDIKVESLIPESLMKTKNIDSFFTKLKMLDKGF